MDKIYLNDLFCLENLDNVRIRFIMTYPGQRNVVEQFQDYDIKGLLSHHYWNYGKHKAYKVGQDTFGFIRMNERDDTWLFFHAGTVTKDLNVYNGVGYEFDESSKFNKYYGRLIIKFHNGSQNLVRIGSNVISSCEVSRILPDIFDDDIFPGYNKVNIDWKKLKRIIAKQNWVTALENQKGVYLITDKDTGKQYVGSATGKDMILGRWMTYVKNGHGGNKNLKGLEFKYIQDNFRYSILEIFKSTTDDNTILARESWWQNTLQTRTFGYN